MESVIGLKTQFKEIQAVDSTESFNLAVIASVKTITIIFRYSLPNHLRPKPFFIAWLSLL